jgi:hypothetical protein
LVGIEQAGAAGAEGDAGAAGGGGGSLGIGSLKGGQGI